MLSVRCSFRSVLNDGSTSWPDPVYSREGLALAAAAVEAGVDFASSCVSCGVQHKCDATAYNQTSNNSGYHCNSQKTTIVEAAVVRFLMRLYP
jgi:hypothetical protein